MNDNLFDHILKKKYIIHVIKISKLSIFFVQSSHRCLDCSALCTGLIWNLESSFQHVDSSHLMLVDCSF
jgi:hypothetical protein